MSINPVALTCGRKHTAACGNAGDARIVRDGGVPIATGENLHTLHEFTHMIAPAA